MFARPRPIHLRGKYRRNCPRDLVLDREDVLQLAVVTLGPAMSARRCIDELRVDANTPGDPAYATFQDVAHTQFTADLSDINRLHVELKARVACDHEQVREPRQLSDDVVGNAVAEVFLLRVAAHVGEAEDSN